MANSIVLKKISKPSTHDAREFAKIARQLQRYSNDVNKHDPNQAFVYRLVPNDDNFKLELTIINKQSDFPNVQYAEFYRCSHCHEIIEVWDYETPSTAPCYMCENSTRLAPTGSV